MMMMLTMSLSQCVCVCIGIDVNMPTDKSGLFCNAANFVVTDAIFRSHKWKGEEKKKKKRKNTKSNDGHFYFIVLVYAFVVCENMKKNAK